MKAVRATRRNPPTQSRKRTRGYSALIYRAHKEVRVFTLFLFEIKCERREWLFISFVGCFTWNEESKLLDPSVEFPQTHPAQTGELGGLSAIKDKQAQSHHSAWDLCCCRSCTAKDLYKSCCIKSWCKLNFTFMFIIKSFKLILLSLCKTPSQYTHNLSGNVEFLEAFIIFWGTETEKRILTGINEGILILIRFWCLLKGF